MDLRLNRALIRDLRRGEAWSRPQRIKNDLIFLAASVALAATRRLPRRALGRMGIGLGTLVHALGPGRSIARRNFARVFPELSPREVARRVSENYRELGKNLATTLVRLFEQPAPPPLNTETKTRLADALAEQRGLLIVSAHLGAWEELAASIAAAGIPLTVIARESYDPRFTKLYDALRERAGIRVLYRETEGLADLARGVLTRGEALGVLLDLKTRAHSLRIRFLGHDAEIPVAPIKWALAHGAPIVVCTAARGRAASRTTLVSSDSLEVKEASSERVTEAARLMATTQKVADALSAHILAYPEGWVWLHPRFDDRGRTSR